jgi:nucleotide-binding universal stress UspA family protein
MKQQTSIELDKKLASLQLTYADKKFDFYIETDQDPANAILHLQQTQSFDLIVIGSHGRKGLERLLMGSIAESLLREATCPVLIIKHK